MGGSTKPQQSVLCCMLDPHLAKSCGLCRCLHTALIPDEETASKYDMQRGGNREQISPSPLGVPSPPVLGATVVIRPAFFVV